MAFLLTNRPVPPGETATGFILLTPKSAGEKRITAKFKSYELNDVDGFKNIRVFEDFDRSAGVADTNVDSNEINNNLNSNSTDYDYNNNNTVRWSYSH